MKHLSRQSGFAHILLLLLLLIGLGTGVYLVTQTQIFKSRATNPPIVFKNPVTNVAFPYQSGAPYTSLTTVKLEFTSTLGPPVGSVSSPSSPTSSRTYSYRYAETPTDLIAKTFSLYTAEPMVVPRHTFSDTSLGTKFIWVEFKDANGNTEQRSAQISMISSTSDPIRVFVTSTTYNGNLGGLAGADAKCQAQANAGSLGGTWQAWLSTSNISIASTLNHSTVPYKLLNGNTIADNWTDLTDGSLQNDIKISELGTETLNSLVWTNTILTGQLRQTDAAATCANWTGGTPGLGNGDVGNTTDRTRNFLGGGYSWTSGGAATCDIQNRLYCFEQPVASASASASTSPAPSPTPTTAPTGGTTIDVPIIGPITIPPIFPPAPSPTLAPSPTPAPVAQPQQCPSNTARQECIGYASNGINTYCWGSGNSYQGGICSASCPASAGCGATTTTNTPAPAASPAAAAGCPSGTVRNECIGYAGNGINNYCWGANNSYLGGTCSASCPASAGQCGVAP